MDAMNQDDYDDAVFYEREIRRRRRRGGWICSCYNPARVANLRSVLLVYSAFVVLQVFHWYATANLSHAHGGRWENPLNDARSFCCVYRHAPCIGGHRAACITSSSSSQEEGENGRLVVPADLNVSSYAVMFYAAHAVVFVVASASLWAPYMWWLFDVRKDRKWREQYITASALVMQMWLLYLRYRVGFPVIQVF